MDEWVRGLFYWIGLWGEGKGGLCIQIMEPEEWVGWMKLLGGDGKAFRAGWVCLGREGIDRLGVGNGDSQVCFRYT